jgi:hypothetical protein
VRKTPFAKKFAEKIRDLFGSCNLPRFIPSVSTLPATLHLSLGSVREAFKRTACVTRSFPQVAAQRLGFTNAQRQRAGSRFTTI